MGEEGKSKCKNEHTLGRKQIGEHTYLDFSIYLYMTLTSLYVLLRYHLLTSATILVFADGDIYEHNLNWQFNLHSQ